MKTVIVSQITYFSLLFSSLPSLPADLTPEEKARGLARAIRKQTGEVRERWVRLKGHVGGWQSQVERALERLQELQSSMDQLDLRLTRAEEAKATWQPVGDLLIDSLQDHIDKTVVSQRDAICTLVIKTARQELDTPPLYTSFQLTALSQLEQVSSSFFFFACRILIGLTVFACLTCKSLI